MRTYQYIKRFPFVKKTISTFISYLHNGNKVKPLNLMLPKTSIYLNIEDDDLVEIYLILYVIIMSRMSFRGNPCYSLSECQGTPCSKQAPYMAPASSKEFRDNQANNRVWIHSETHTWHDYNIQSNAPYR